VFALGARRDRDVTVARLPAREINVVVGVTQEKRLQQNNNNT